MHDFLAAAGYGLLIAGVSVLGLYVFCWITLLVHEGGHFFVARSVEMKVESVRLGEGRRFLTVKRAGVQWEVHAWPMSGSVQVGEGVFAYSTRQLTKMILGGPVATLLLAIVLTWFFYPQPWAPPVSASPTHADHYDQASELEAILRLAVACLPGTLVTSGWAMLLGCLIPRRLASGAPTDGLQLWWLWFPKWRPGATKKAIQARGPISTSSAVKERARRVGD